MQQNAPNISQNVIYLPLFNRKGVTMIKNRIKEFRAKLGINQEELAFKVGVRRETIGNLENGRYNPSLVLAWKVAKVFDVPIEEVFTVDEIIR